MTRDRSDEAGAEPGSGGGSTLEQRIEHVVASLQNLLGSTVEPDVIRAEVEAEFASYSQARIFDFVPVLVETRVRERLTRQRSRGTRFTSDGTERLEARARREVRHG
jgi:hypothetical protein